MIKRLRWSAGPGWTPLRLDLAHRELPCRERWVAFFGDRVRFDRPVNALWIDPTTLARRSTTADARLYSAMRVACAAEIETYATPRNTTTDVRRSIQQRLAGRAPDLEAIAEAMSLTGRQLQWKLEQEGTTFEAELGETRRLTAERLLATTDLSMTQIASAVGFSELSSFTRACTRTWFGISPSEYRAKSRWTSSVPAA